MKQLAMCFIGCLICCLAIAQKGQPVTAPLAAAYWTADPEHVKFIRENDGPVMKILPGAGRVIAKDLDFADGTIEFDVKPGSLSFYFRMKDADENECFYLRMGQAGNPTAVDAVQYAPLVGGVLLWDMLSHFQTNAAFTKDAWNHVKLVVSGAQMRLYINSPAKPTLEVDRLEGNPKRGTIAFEGEMSVKNLQIKPNQVEGLSPAPGVDLTGHDPRYIRSWAVSTPIVTPKDVDFSYDFLPTPETSWQVLETERRGLLNLTRAFGKSEPRRLVWLKVKIKSASAQKKKVDFGFGDDVWVFLNGEMAYVDQNRYGRPIAKEPDGRCSIENTSFSLPLKAGNNELLIGLANDFYGWGAIARLDNTEGIEVTPDPTFDSRLIKLPEAAIDAYAGNYVLPDGKPVTVTKENNVLKLSGKGFITALLYPEAETKFFTREYDLQIEFIKAGNTVSNFIIYNNGKPVIDIKRVY